MASARRDGSGSGCLTVAVRGFHDDGVHSGRVCRRYEHGVMGSPEIAAEEHAVAVDLESGRGRTEDVSCRSEGEDRSGRELLRGVHRSGRDQGERSLDVCSIVERESRCVLGEPPLVGVRRVLFLQVGAVLQHDGGELGCLGGADHATVEALAHELGQVAGVVEMRVGENDVVDGGGIHRKPGPVPLSQGGQTLIETGVDEDPGVGAFEQEAATGHGPGGAQEGQGGVCHDAASPLLLTSPSQSARIPANAGNVVSPPFGTWPAATPCALPASRRTPRAARRSGWPARPTRRSRRPGPRGLARPPRPGPRARRASTAAPAA